MLIVGAGIQQRNENAVHLDQYPFPGIDIVHDLNQVPWPVETESFAHISAIHVVEHLRSLIDFMNEAHRVLKRGGSLYIETPEAGADYDLTHADPTHIRCYRKYTFVNYFSPEGVIRWAYTDKSWAIYKIVSENGVLKFHGGPIK